MKCQICGKEVVLSPSANERAAKYGGSPGYYTRLFPVHPSCSFTKREQETKELMRRTGAISHS